MKSTNQGDDAQSGEDNVRTLFVSGLPPDVKTREIYLLFRHYPDYESSQIKLTYNKNGKTASPVGFVTFKSHSGAETAMQDLQGVQFDPEYPQVLRLEFARSNTKVSHPKQTSPLPGLVFPISATNGFAVHSNGVALPTNGINGVTLSTNGLAVHTNNSVPNGLSPQDSYSAVASVGNTGNGGYIIADPSSLTAWPTAGQNGPIIATPYTNGQPGTLLQHALLTQLPIRFPTAAIMSALSPGGLSAGLGLSGALTGFGASAATIAPFTPHQTTNNQPCSTLFVANLGPSCTETELTDTFGRCYGFRRVQLLTKGGSPVAFVEFQSPEDAANRYHPYKKRLQHEKSIQCATEAMNQLQGTILQSCDRGGIRIEYAKSQMGKMSSREDSQSDPKKLIHNSTIVS